MRQLLALTEARQWDILTPADQARLLAVLAAADGGLDLRLPLVDRPDASQWCRDMRRIADQARAAGCRVRAHSWVGRGVRVDGVEYAAATAADGVIDGQRATVVGAYVGAERWGANAEHTVHRGRAGKWWPHAEAYLNEVVESHGHARAVDYVGFPDPSVHYPGARWTPGHTDIYDGLGAMMYQRAAASLVTRWRRVARIWPVDTDGRRRPRAWWTGIGRDADTGGDYRETLKAWRIILADDPDALHEVVWYCGLRQSGDPDGPHQPHKMLVDGRRGHPPLVDVVPLVALEWPA